MLSKYWHNLESPLEDHKELKEVTRKFISTSSSRRSWQRKCKIPVFNSFNPLVLHTNMHVKNKIWMFYILLERWAISFALGNGNLNRRQIWSRGGLDS